LQSLRLLESALSLEYDALFLAENQFRGGVAAVSSFCVALPSFVIVLRLLRLPRFECTELLFFCCHERLLKQLIVVQKLNTAAIIGGVLGACLTVSVLLGVAYRLLNTNTDSDVKDMLDERIAARGGNRGTGTGGNHDGDGDNGSPLLIEPDIRG
jgi:hypothetical protein